MLGKTLKYEMRANGRLLFPLFGVAIALSAVLRLMLLIAPLIWAPIGRAMEALISSVGILVLVAVMVLAFVAVLVRFYQSMVGLEGYLTFTLPVKASTHIMARTISGMLYSLLGFVVALICGMIFIPGFFSGFIDVMRGILTVNSFAENYTIQLPGTKTALFFFMVALVIIVSMACTLLQLYAAFSLGAQAHSNRGLISILAYFGLNTVEGLISLPLITIPVMAYFGGSEERLENFFIERLEPFFNTGNPNDVVNGILIIMALVLAATVIINGLFAVINFLIAKYYFSKKLNLQ